MGVTLNCLADFIEIDNLEDMGHELPFRPEVLPTVLLLSAIIRHARNDLNTRAYHRSGCCYYRGIMFGYHVELLQACFAASGLPYECITANNARREAELTLGLEPGYLEPQHLESLNAPGAAASAALALYRVAARNKHIAETVLSQHMPKVLDNPYHINLSDEEIEWLEHHFEQKKSGESVCANTNTAHPPRPLYSHEVEHCIDDHSLELSETTAGTAWALNYMIYEQMEFWN